MQYFNYQSLADLPLIEEFADNENDMEMDLFDSKGMVDRQIEKEGE